MSEPVPSMGQRWSEVTQDDHGGFIYIASFLCLTYTGLAFVTRGFIKWRVVGFDDYMTALAQIAHLVQFALLMRALSSGLAKNFELLNSDEYNYMTSMQYGNQIALYVSIGLSKCATILLTQRLFTRDMKKAWMICNIIIALMLAWTVAAAFLVSVGCSPESIAPFPSQQACSGIISRYTAVVATDIVTDVILAIAPAYLVWQLQMSVLLKLQVLAVFSFRLPVVPLAIMALRDWKRSLTSANPGVDRATAIVYQQSELCVALMAATIPCLTSFIRSFDTGSGVKVGYSSNEYGSGNQGGHSESYKMSNMSRSYSASGREDDEGDIKLDSRPYPKARVKVTAINGNMSTSFTPSKPQEDDAVSHGSQELFIRRDVGWEVRSDQVR